MMYCIGLPIMLMIGIVIRWIIDLNFLGLQFEICICCQTFFDVKRTWKLERLGPFTINRANIGVDCV
jgi:hypothetical protein